MKKTIVFVCCALLTACQGAKFPEGIEHVIVIGIDGMSSQGLIQAHTPCMDSLKHAGAYSYKVRCILPSVSSPNWHAMLSGAGPELTGVLDNSWRRGVYELPPVTLTDNGYFPGIFRIIRDRKPQAVTASFYNWGGFGDLLEKEVIDSCATFPSQLETAKHTAAYIRDKKPDFVFIQLDEIDGAGHESGHMSPGYLRKIEETDTHVRLIVDAVAQAGIAGSTLIMVVSDHGGIFYWHGGNAYEEVSTPIIFAGPGVRKDYSIRQQIYKYDVAADVAFALGLETPQAWVGRPTCTAYEGFGNGPAPTYGETEVLPPPMFYADPVAVPHGGLSVDKPAEVVIKKPVGVEGDIRYTLDGSMPTRTSALYDGTLRLEKSARVMAKLFGANCESPRVSAQYRVADSKAGNGLHYTFYTLPSDIREMPAFTTLKPVAEGICYELDFFAPGFSDLRTRYPQNMAVCFTGWIEIEKEGPYTFYIWTKGGSKLYIKSDMVLNNRRLGDSETKGEIYLEKGRHPLRLEYARKQHLHPEVQETINLEYEGEGMFRQKIPADRLFLNKN
ncbi:MAG: alkaline phosphatase family protein [Tannerella sp.]|nr:alkaline phosphatase family protein [Tannerella sp.]